MSISWYWYIYIYVHLVKNYLYTFTSLESVYMEKVGYHCKFLFIYSLLQKREVIQAVQLKIIVLLDPSSNLGKYHWKIFRHVPL